MTRWALLIVIAVGSTLGMARSQYVNNLSALAGKTVRPRFHLQSGKR